MFIDLKRKQLPLITGIIFVYSFCMYVFTQHLCHEHDAIQGQFFKRSLTGLKNEVYRTILHIAGGRIAGVQFFQRVWTLYQMQIVLPRMEYFICIPLHIR